MHVKRKRRERANTRKEEEKKNCIYIENDMKIVRSSGLPSLSLKIVIICATEAVQKHHHHLHSSAIHHPWFLFAVLHLFHFNLFHLIYYSQSWLIPPAVHIRLFIELKLLLLFFFFNLLFRSRKLSMGWGQLCDSSIWELVYVLLLLFFLKFSIGIIPKFSACLVHIGSADFNSIKNETHVSFSASEKKTHTHFFVFFFRSLSTNKYIGTLIIQSIMSIIFNCVFRHQCDGSFLRWSFAIAAEWYYDYIYDCVTAGFFFQSCCV